MWLLLNNMLKDTPYAARLTSAAPLLSKLRGRDVRITHGLAETLKQLESESEEFKQKIVDKRFTGPVARIVKPARVT